MPPERRPCYRIRTPHRKTGWRFLLELSIFFHERVCRMSAKSTKPAVKKCVLAYSGGLDTSIIVPWLKNTYKCEVIAFCANPVSYTHLTLPTRDLV